MIADHSEGRKYLNDLRQGKIKLGLGVDCLLDENLRFKKGQLTIINGHDNVGKTYWILWYFLTLTRKHGLTWTIYSSENTIASVKRDLIQFHTAKKIDALTEADLYKAFDYISMHFTFISIEDLYKPKELINLFKESNTDGYLIDPMTSLLNDKVSINKHETDNEVLLHIKTWCKQVKKSVYINTHCSTESTRKVYPRDHDLAGHIMPPLKADTIGGQKNADRADDFITIHRLVQHESNWMFTDVHVRKIKDTQTGGRTTYLDAPIRCKLSWGCEFSVAGVNPLEEKQYKPELKHFLDD